jgi:hypothetical protein
MDKSFKNKPPILGEDELIESLGNTLGSFENKLQKRLQEQATETNKTQEANTIRNKIILQGLNTIRKALNETQNIKLGDRFSLELDVNDWNGWPRLELNLVDSQIPDGYEQTLTVSIQERNETGIIEFKNKMGLIFGDLAMTSEQELTRIPIVLKKSVRAFLDQVAEYVINPLSPEEAIKTRTHFEEIQPIKNAKELADAELFLDPSYLQKNDKDLVEHSTPHKSIQEDELYIDQSYNLSENSVIPSWKDDDEIDL